MQQRLIARGVLAGGLGGLIAFVFSRIFAEPLIQRSIDYEAARDAAQAVLDKAAGRAVSPEEAEVFTRTVQADVGLALATILLGAAMGALFAVAYAVCLGRTGAVRPRPLAYLVAAGGFGCFYLVPFVKYPANPPAIGHAETIRDRAALYVVMVACSVLFGFLAVYLGQKLATRIGSRRAALCAGAGFVVAIGVVAALLPAVGELSANVAAYGRHASETPRPLTAPDGTIVFPGFDADLLYRFRLCSVAAQAILWTTIALVFAPLADRLLRPPASADPAHDPADLPAVGSRA